MSSPTVSLEGLIITLVADSYEQLYVATFNVPGAYFHSKIPKEKKIILKLWGNFVDIMRELNPKRLSSVVVENGYKVFYIQILRVIYV